MGTRPECAAAVAALRAGFVVREVSEFYPNRGQSVLGRVYVDAEPITRPAAVARVRATATSADQAHELPPGGTPDLTDLDVIDRAGGPSC